MTIRIFYFCICISVLLGSCKSSISCNDYFSTVSVDEIKELSVQKFLYKTDYLDDDYREFGTYDNPQLAFNIEYDTLSHYRVILWGYVALSDANQTDNTQIVDSIAITSMIVLRSHHMAERFSNNCTVNNNFDKPWKDCPLPMSVRNKIKNDFLIRMKYRKYNIKERVRRITVYYEYKLYESD